MPLVVRVVMMKLLIPISALLVLGSCVSKKKYTMATAHVDKLRGDSLAYEDQVRGLRAELYGMAGTARMTAEELEARKRELKAKDAELQEKARRMDELDRRLEAQTAAMNGLRKKVADALVNFKAEELSVSMRDGKVYVSLSEKLLFPSGSAAVEPKGKDALTQLAAVMTNNTDIDMMVEGHTDNVPIKRGRFDDNWDLSTARATSIVRILLGAGMDPKRVTAAGRSEFAPIASNDTAEGKQRNRRTEIILIPRLDELYSTVDPTLTSPTPKAP